MPLQKYFYTREAIQSGILHIGVGNFHRAHQAFYTNQLLKDVQELYETIYDKPFARNNFQKKILDLNVLERLEKKYTGAQNKAPFLYRFIKK